MSLIMHLVEYLEGIAFRRWKRLGGRIWSDPLQRSGVLFAEAMELAEIVAVSTGKVVRRAIIEPTGEGTYTIDIRYTDDPLEETYAE